MTPIDWHEITSNLVAVGAMISLLTVTYFLSKWYTRDE